MASRHPHQGNDTTQDAGTVGRKPYSPPRILSREPLEAMAAICSPRPPAKANAGTCSLGPINS
jgi:hypothetical protein